ncbi:MAG: putative DNA binding domain-containing protein [Deltaproteobacteria bacterium]|nr:putative DNA binding domain-containing protein [Deltaproteobacteria bacterium]
MRSAASLLEELRALDESHEIEAKRGSAIDRSVLETVCAFANEPGLGGGHLLLGVVPSTQLGLFGRTYEVEGVREPDKLQSDLASQCASAFNRPVRPQIAVEEVEGKPVLVVFVAESAPTEKPLYLTKLGLPRGAFRRVGPTDQEGTEDDLVALYQGHQQDTYDAAVLADADLDDLDSEAIRVYRQLREAANSTAEELAWSDRDLLRALGAVAMQDGTLRPTVAGVLLFGTSMALRRCFPMMRVDYIRIPGREWVQDPDRRFDTVEIRAPLILATRRAIAAVHDDLPTSFSLPEGSALRKDEPVLPTRVLREAIVNAVMHRSYRIHSPIQILRYANRLEVRNPGHSLKAEEQLGEPGSQTRNPRIAAVLHDIHLAETKGSGIRVMRELMLAQDLLPPTFESSRRPDQFVATFLFHHFLGVDDLAWLTGLTGERLSDEEMRAMVVVRELGAIDNASYRSINRVDTLSASHHLRRLRDLGLLEMKGSGSRTYYLPTARVVSDVPMATTYPHHLGADLPMAGADLPMADSDLHQLGSDLPMAGSDLPMAGADLPMAGSDLPMALRDRVRKAGSRPRQHTLRPLIVAICAVRPHSARELASIFGDRDAKNLAREHLRPMLESGELVYTVPEMPKHPEQKYTTPEATPA